MRKYNLQKGFTLVEMMVVVAIIAILAGAFLIGLSGFRSSAYDARRLSDLQKVQGYIELYYNKHGEYPNVSAWSDLEKELTDSSSGVGITSIPHDPQASALGRDYEYGVDSADFQSYVLKATLSDGDNKALDNDVDGDVYDVDCEDPAYCVMF